jgi:hypothetical protein
MISTSVSLIPVSEMGGAYPEKPMIFKKQAPFLDTKINT